MYLIWNSAALFKERGNIMEKLDYNPYATTGTKGSGSESVGTGSSGGNGGASSDLMSAIKNLNDVFATNKLLRAERQKETTAVRDTRQAYSKDAAFADAQGLMNQELQKAMQDAMQTINTGAAGAGASAGSMRALLTQQAADNAAQSAAALGANQAVQYGGISNQASGILEMLTRPDDTSLTALMSALAIQQRANEAQKSSLPSTGARTSTGSGSNQQTIKSAKQPTVTAAIPMNASFGSGNAPTGLPDGVSHIFSQPNYTSNVLGGLQYYGPTATNADITKSYTNLLNRTPATQQDAVNNILSPNPLNNGLAF